MNFLKDAILVLFSASYTGFLISVAHWDYFSTKGVTDPKYQLAITIVLAILWIILGVKEDLSLLRKHGNTTN